MASLADLIEAYLKQLIAEQEEEILEIQRSKLADRFDCVPSQITYVLRTRFAPQHGYRTLSIRGGGGFIRITRQAVNSEVLEDIQELSEKKAHFFIDELYQRQRISSRVRSMLKIATSDQALGINGPQADQVRTSLLKALTGFLLSQ